MNAEEFEAAGQQMIKYVIEYNKTIRERRVMSDVKPGFMRKLLPDHAPQTPEKWDQVYKDIERIIMPGPIDAMNNEEFEAAGQQMLKYVIDYHKKIRERRVLPDVKPGFMRKLLPDHAPQTPEKWDQVYKDIERVIMLGVK